jgi:glycosyltransferase involved in cell wall biosynthesis
MADVKLLYFSANRWGNMARRKPRLAHEFACYSDVASVLYVEPSVETSLLDLARGRLDPEYLEPTRRAHARALLGLPRRVEEKVWAYTGSVKTVPLTRLEAIRQMRVLHRLNQRLYYAGVRRTLQRLPGERLIVWLSHPLQAGALEAFRHRALACYDWTDDWAAFDVLSTEDPSQTVALNDRVLQQVDLVFAVSADLERRATSMNSRTYRIPNATGAEMLDDVQKEGPVAAELAALEGPVIGYLGTVSDKIDYDLVDQMARLQTDWHFVFLGPVWERHHERAVDLKTLGNVHFLGKRSFDQLGPYLRGFDVCMLPHKLTPLTRSMDPIKMYDYLNTGRPIVSTPVAGIERFADVISVGSSPEDFVAEIEAGLCEDAGKATRRIAYARENTWRQRAAQVWSIVEDALS